MQPCRETPHLLCKACSQTQDLCILRFALTLYCWILKLGLHGPLPSSTPGSGCCSIGLPSLPSSLAPIVIGGCRSLAQPGPHHILSPVPANVLWLSQSLLSPPPKSAHIPANKHRYVLTSSCFSPGEEYLKLPHQVHSQTSCMPSDSKSLLSLPSLSQLLCVC